MRSVVRQPPISHCESVGAQLAEVVSAVPVSNDQPGIVQYLHVLRHRGQRHVEGFAQLTHASRTPRELVQHAAPDVARKRMEHRVELHGLHNHVVKRRLPDANGQLCGYASDQGEDSPVSTTIATVVFPARDLIAAIEAWIPVF